MECAVYDDRSLEKDDRTAESSVTGEGPLVITASADELTRQMLSHYLEGLDLRVQEACNAAEAASLYSASPAALVVFDGSLQEEDMIQALAAVRMFEGEQSLAAVPFLLLARSELQAERMGKAGCDEALLPPLVRKDLRAMVKWLLAPAGTMSRPVLSSQRVTLAAVLAGTHTASFRLQRKGERRGMRVEKAEEDLLERKEPDLLVDAGPLTEGEDNAPVQKDVHDESAAEGADTANIHGSSAQPQEQDEVLQYEPEADMPMKRIYELLDVLSGAVERLESGTVRRGSAELAFIAQEYGMVTLADMARCFRAAWEEGDVGVAGQIVDEMRAEAARQ
jgi:CheY-like chemotaxis protein